MAELQQICIEGFCSDVPEYTAGDGIVINNHQISAIATDLSNYYDKSEVDALVNAIETGEFVIVDSLPQTGNPKDIYLVPKQGGGYTEHVYVNDEWNEFGDTDIDLSNYYTKSEVDALIASMALNKNKILNALGYEETTLTMTDTDNNSITKTILIKSE